MTPIEEKDLVIVPTDPQEEIARLKDLLSFATRPDKPSSLARAEIAFKKDGSGQIVCVTCPGADEHVIARFLVRRLEEVWEHHGVQRAQMRLVTAVDPLMKLQEKCKHTKGRGGACRDCLQDALSAIASMVNQWAPPEEDDEPSPTPEAAK